MYSKTNYPFCQMAKDEFRKIRVTFDLVELNEISDGAKQEEILKDISGQSTVPNIFIGGQHVGGYSELFEKI